MGLLLCMFRATATLPCTPPGSTWADVFHSRPLSSSATHLHVFNSVPLPESQGDYEVKLRFEPRSHDFKQFALNTKQLIKYWEKQIPNDLDVGVQRRRLTSQKRWAKKRKTGKCLEYENNTNEHLLSALCILGILLSSWYAFPHVTLSTALQGAFCY